MLIIQFEMTVLVPLRPCTGRLCSCRLLIYLCSYRCSSSLHRYSCPLINTARSDTCVAQSCRWSRQPCTEVPSPRTSRLHVNDRSSTRRRCGQLCSYLCPEMCVIYGLCCAFGISASHSIACILKDTNRLRRFADDILGLSSWVM